MARLLIEVVQQVPTKLPFAATRLWPAAGLRPSTGQLTSQAAGLADEAKFGSPPRLKVGCPAGPPSVRTRPVPAGSEQQL